MKRIVIIAMSILALSACVQEELTVKKNAAPAIVGQIDDAFTRTSYAEEGPVATMGWLENDQISVLIYDPSDARLSGGYYNYRAQESGKTVRFACEVTPDYERFRHDEIAYYPGNATIRGDKDAREVAVSGSYTVYDSDFTRIGIPLIGVEDAENEDFYKFTPAGGVLKVTLENLSTDARRLVLNTEADNLSGFFRLDPVEGLKMSGARSSIGHKITVTFPSQTEGSTINVYVPVPVGTISAGATFSVCRADDSVIVSTDPTTRPISVVRGHLIPVGSIEVVPVFHEVTVYYENMDKNLSYKSYMSNTDWINATGPGATSVSYDSWNASIRNDNYGSAGNIGTYSGASGACYGRITQSNNGVFGHLTVSNISTCGYENFRFSFGAAQNKDVLKLEVSPDGSEWTQLDYSFGKSYNNWDRAVATFSVRSTVSTVHLRFTLIGAKADYSYGANIDDLKLEAIADPSAVLIGHDAPAAGSRCAELPVYIDTNPDWYYNTLYTTTVSSGKHVRNFSFCYDTRRHNPIWVAFPMHEIYAEGSGRSKDEFGNDPWMQYPDLPVEKQSIIWDITGDGSHQYWSYHSLASGMWTKGHLCMSSSRAGAGMEINLQTFYPVNIAPQSNAYAGIFSDLWSLTEEFHWQRGAQICSDTLYVVAGCHYANESNVEYDACDRGDTSEYSKACIMPTHQYKLFLRTRDGNTGKAVQDCSADELKAIGFWFDAVVPSGASVNLADYALSVAEIETRTGFTFFPTIPTAVKSQCTPSDWGL